MHGSPEYYDAWHQARDAEDALRALHADWAKKFETRSPEYRARIVTRCALARAKERK